jgi:hypothetical protein
MLHEALRDVESDPTVPPEAVSSLAWSIEQSLAFMPQGLGVQALLEASSRPSPGLKEPASAASSWQRQGWVLANQLPIRALLATLGSLSTTSPGPLEVLACWMHEWVARGQSLEGEEPARRLQELLAASHHPLAVLPLRYLGVEENIRGYHRDHVIENHLRGEPLGNAGARTLPEPVPHEVRDAALCERMATVAREWSPANRRLEARVFTLSPPVAPEALGTDLLVRLGLACLGDMSQDVLGAVTRADADIAFRQLFAASAYGGPWTPGRFGAYGRLDAWRSLAALVGVDERAPLPEVERQALACTWLDLRGVSEWFSENTWGWELGLAALRPDGASIAVLAATGWDDEPEWA